MRINAINSSLVLLTFILSGAALVSAENEIGFIEKFALADQREQALQLLIPGTDDYYYFHMLHYQNEGDTEKYGAMLTSWKKRNNGNTPGRAKELINRQALIDYPENPQASLKHIIEQERIRFNHQRRVEGAVSTLPKSLDPKMIATETLLKNGLADKRNLNRLTDDGLQIVADKELSPDQRRNLLSRLRYPDYPGLVRLITLDLKFKGSKGFGSLTIHRNLTLLQLDALADALPKLKNEQKYIEAYLLRLSASEDVDLTRDVDAHQAQLARTWNFVSTLEPVHNSLKAITLYRQLELDRSQGIFNKKRFLQYIKLPRRVSYINPDWLREPANKNYTFQLNQNHARMGQIGHDDALVTNFLRHFFVEAKNYNEFAPYIKDTFLKKVFAQTKIEHGIGDAEKWASMLSPSDYQTLKERIDIDLAPENQVYFQANDPVAITADVKHVKELLVKVFEINTLNYYREKQAEIDLAINLDGLIASSEQRFTYDEAPERRVRRTFTFPDLKERGVYVVELIGNGQSSRALISKGRLDFLMKNTAAGHRFTILDQQNNPVKSAQIWLGNRTFEANEDGQIMVPYSTNPTKEKAILLDGDFASLRSFYHQAETYQLNAGFYVDREALLKGSKANVAIKSLLHASGVPTTVDLLKKVNLTIESTDRYGIKSQKVVPDFKLFDDRESVYEFKVPDHLATIRFSLSAEIKNVSRNKQDTLSSARSFELNGIDRTMAVDGIHLSHPASGYLLELVGKTGEARPGQVVQFEFKHRFFKDTIRRSLQTDEGGMCALGQLPNIEWIKIKAPNGHEHTWYPKSTHYTFPGELHGSAGETLSLPLWMDVKDQAAACSLFEIRSGTIIADWRKALSWADGLLQIKGLPPGDFSLHLHPVNSKIDVRVTAGKKQDDYIVSATRKLQASPTTPVHFQGAKVAKEGVTFAIAHATPFTRVHVFATRYEAEYSLRQALGYVGAPGLLSLKKDAAVSFYVSGRNIGDEYRYILERKLHKKYPGNMLERPGLLLNPWAVQDTSADLEALAAGGAYDSAVQPASMAPRPKVAPARAGSRSKNYFNLDFLKHPTQAFYNLMPNKDGVIHIKAEQLGDKTQLAIILVDPQTSQLIHLSLPDQDRNIRDLRLANNLDPAMHLTEQKRVTIAPKAKPFIIEDVTTSTFESYDTVADVHNLLLTLSNNDTLRTFSFITSWPDLTNEEKESKYSQFACHELTFFLYHKDRPFFDRVISGYLKNKKDKTFVDYWLLEDDLQAYLEPWKFGRLNIVERILLGKRIKEQHPALERHVHELNEIIPPDIQAFNVRFDTASAASGLDADGAFDALASTLTIERRGGEKSLEFAGAIAGGTRLSRQSNSREEVPAESSFMDMEGEMAKKLSKKSSVKRGENKSVAEVALFDGYEGKRDSQRGFFQKLEKTKEWAENNYYHLRIEQQLSTLVKANAFWADYAAHEGNRGFLSNNLTDTSRNFPEMMLALAVLDLPFNADEHPIESEGARFQITPKNDIIVFHKEIRESTLAEDRPPILVSQHFFRNDDRYRHEGNEKYDKYVKDEFLRHVVYGCQVILTNPTSNPQKLSILLQIPKGAIPLANGFETRGNLLQLEAYSTETIEYFFYFPATGKFPHYPVHVAKDQELIAHAAPQILKVVEKLSKIDRTSWGWISQNGSTEELITYLNENNLERLKLEDIAWRMQEKPAFTQLISLLNERHKYNHTLWMYALKHNVQDAAREYLQYAPYANKCGVYIDTPLLSIDPIDRHLYQHLEYAPLVNARAHRVGKEPTILNHRLRSQYQQLTRYLSYKAKLDDTDRLAVTYYLALQDRIEEALTWFASINSENVVTDIQFDYLKAFLGMYEGKVDQARAIATSYEKYPVPRWQNKFLNIISQIDGAKEAVDAENRDQSQEQLAASEPALEFEVEARKIQLKYQHLSEVQINFYPMDIELLFSRNPFIQDQSAQFSYIRPVLTRTVALPPDQHTFSYELPQQFHSANVMVEVVAGGIHKSQAYYANTLNVQLIENYGQLRVSHIDSGQALDTVYVKVYGRLKGGEVKFFKDGYTDFRGRFDYVSLNTTEIDYTERLALLILSEKHGAMILETNPPKR